MLRPLDVIIIYDQTIEPPGPKMVVCIDPDLGLFFRINTNPWGHPPIRLNREPDHPWLDHDSHLECGGALDLDEYLVMESIRRKGVIGRVSQKLIPQIYAAVQKERTFSEEEKIAIKQCLGC